MRREWWRWPRTWRQAIASRASKLAFNTWATALVYHAEQEVRHITDPLKDNRGQDHAGPEHVAGRVKTQIAALEEDLHEELLRSVQDLLAMLNDEIGKTSVIARTKNHLQPVA